MLLFVCVTVGVPFIVCLCSISGPERTTVHVEVVWRPEKIKWNVRRNETDVLCSFCLQEGTEHGTSYFNRSSWESLQGVFKTTVKSHHVTHFWKMTPTVKLNESVWQLSQTSFTSSKNLFLYIYRRLITPSTISLSINIFRHLVFSNVKFYINSTKQINKQIKKTIKL